MLKYILFFILSASLLGCEKEAFTSDGLHIFPKESSDMINASFSLKVKGGERHLNKIDWGEDSLPASSKSCHHGGEVLSPQRCIIKAFYDKENIYFYLSWDDKTKDINSPFWDNNTFKDSKDDGISFIFSKNPTFNCTKNLSYVRCES